VNKAELTSALAMRTKMSKADARAPSKRSRRKGIIATELKKGSKVQITRLAISERASAPQGWVATEDGQRHRSRRRSLAFRAGNS